MSHLSSAATRGVFDTVRSLHCIFFVPPMQYCCLLPPHVLRLQRDETTVLQNLYGLAAFGPMSLYLLLFKKSGKTHLAGMQAAAF